MVSGPRLLIQAGLALQEEQRQHATAVAELTLQLEAALKDLTHQCASATAAALAAAADAAAASAAAVAAAADAAAASADYNKAHSGGPQHVEDGIQGNSPTCGCTPTCGSYLETEIHKNSYTRKSPSPVIGTRGCYIP